MEKEVAREQITAAIKNFLVASDMLNSDEELVSSWALVVHMEKVEDDGLAYYGHITSSETMPSHVADGLFYEALTSGKTRGVTPL